MMTSTLKESRSPLVRALMPGRPPATHRERRRSKRQARTVASQLVACLAAVLLWQIACSTGVVSSTSIASPVEVVRALGPLLRASSFWAALSDTLQTWALGLGLSILVGIPLGLLLGASFLGYRLTRFTIEFCRSIPAVALLPLALLLYGATPRMALVLVVFGSVWPILVQSVYGARSVDRVARDMAASYRIRRLDRVFRLLVPSAGPLMATGIRIAATMSLLLVIGAEVIGGAPGIGLEFQNYSQAGDIPAMFALVVVSAVLGLALNLGLQATERRVLSWHAVHRVPSQ
ncbi:ABC transporter permease [Amycolatopsis pithecellobii]|uniref:ABC transporter permease subunit n=1 Tax=Amycolatopsis pithecellobii TaxID=664692 RepID=A0A6N7Z7T9_9PSEU|nr:ABC transporter permease [Amycolatopsis pithecellobii]MTD57441.1 ABC transporter permease subunit [Amycolatopsis pithecellobii]